MLRGILIKCLLLTKLNCINVLILHVLNKTLSAIVYKTKHKCLYRDDNDRYISIPNFLHIRSICLKQSCFTVYDSTWHFNLSHFFYVILVCITTYYMRNFFWKNIFLTFKSSISPILLKHFFRNKKSLFKYYKMIKYGTGWSHQNTFKGLYNRFITSYII